jgi:hypothetical protein
MSTAKALKRSVNGFLGRTDTFSFLAPTSPATEAISACRVEEACGTLGCAVLVPAMGMAAAVLDSVGAESPVATGGSRTGA